MTLEELMGKIPDEFKPIAAQYGPALVKMTTEEIWAWIALIARGNTDEALRQMNAKLDDHELLTEFEGQDADWAEANKDNAIKIDLIRQAGVAVLRVLLTMAITMVGL